MRNLTLLLITLLAANSLVANEAAEKDILKVKISWLNAKECGIEGCKPQNIILHSGDSVSFGWPQIKERPFFSIEPSLMGETARALLTRFKKNEENDLEPTDTAKLQAALSKEEIVKLGDIEIGVTITKEESKQRH